MQISPFTLPSLKSWETNTYSLLPFPLIFLAHRFPTPSTHFCCHILHRVEGHRALGRVLLLVLQTVSPVWLHYQREKSCWAVLSPDFGFASYCLTAGKLFELSILPPLSWDDKIDLPVVRIEPGNLRKCNLMPDPWAGAQYIMVAVLCYYYHTGSASFIHWLMCVPHVVMQRELWRRIHY